jgi:8-oxo-dGTP diphosphatase
VHYANSAPAVSALVLDEDGRVLLARRAGDPYAGLWDTPGGFLEEGEDAEEGLRREFREEAGVEIGVGAFVGAYVDRYGDDPDAPAFLALLWRAEIASGEPEAADDVSELRWFSPDELPADEEIAFNWIARFLATWSASDSRCTKGPANRPFG